MPSTALPTGTRFQQSAGSKEQLRERWLTTVPPAEVFSGLAMDKDFQRSFERQQGLPVDAAKKILRSYSPFTIEVVPPLVFANDPTLENGIKTKRNVGLVGSAWKKNNAFEKATGRINSRNLRSQKFVNDTSRQILERFVAAGVQYRNSSTDKSKHTGQGSAAEPAISDVKVAADIALQLGDILRLPPLTLLINPQNFQTQYNKIQQFSERTRFGYIFQAWGEEQPKISFQGKTGAFYAGAALRDPQRAFVSNQTDKGLTTPTGVQFASKRNSAAWQNLMSMFQMYRNNGYIYDRVGKSNAHLLVGGLAIKYDQWTYIGNINSFGFGYEETNMHGGMTFDIDFTVVAMIDNAQTVEIVQPMRSPINSPSDPAYSPTSQRIIQRSVSNETQTSIATGAGLEVSSPVGQVNTIPGIAEVSQPPSITTLPRSAGGFRTPAADTTVATPTVQRTPQPFIGPGREEL